MNVDKQTLEIFSTIGRINPGIVVKSGNIIKARSQSAEIPIIQVEFANVIFPRDFAIYDIAKLLSVCSMFDNPVFEFTETHLIIRDGNKKSAKFRYADPRAIKHIDYDKNINIGNQGVDYQFELSAANLKQIVKAISSFGCEQIALISDGQDLSITTYDSSNVNADRFDIQLDNCQHKFTIIINAAHFQFVNRDYIVRGSFKGLIELTGQTDHNTIKYWITASEKSKINA